MGKVLEQALSELKQGARLVDRMNGNIYLAPNEGEMQRISRNTFATLKQQGLVQRSSQFRNPFVRTYELKI